jgi:DNA-directed RNA polymerase subunit omega
LADIVRKGETISTKGNQNYMNAELVKQALAKIDNPHVLVNMVSRRVRQLNAGGRMSRSLLADTGTLGLADIALLEIIEDKMSFNAPEIIALTRPTARDRNRPQGWGKPQAVKLSPQT